MSVNLSRRDFFKFAGLTAGLAVASNQAKSAGASAGTADQAGEQVSMLYDTTKCIGCRACQTACREANGKPVELDETGRYDVPVALSGSTWTVIQLYNDGGESAQQEDWSFVKRNCMHCVDPACVSACTIGALQKTPEGPVTYNDDVCFGCRYCMVACPYDVPKYQWDTTSPFVQKCDFCVNNGRMGGGEGPACVDVCPTGALVFGTRDELLADAHARIADNPGTYHEDRIYGEQEAGGTLQLYLSHVPFEQLGLPTLGPDALPPKTQIANWSVPGIIVGMGGLMTAAYFVRKDKE
jgi:formate dehydrogenase beta subunit